MSGPVTQIRPAPDAEVIILIWNEDLLGTPFRNLLLLSLQKKTMSLIYGVVAHGPTILAEHTNSTGNFATGKITLEL